MQAMGIASAAGSLIKGIGGLQAGNYNKKVAYGQAREEEATANADALRVRDDARRQIGQQIGAQFSNGFMGGTGSALDALKESQVNAALDVMEARRRGQSKANALRSQGDMAQQQGEMDLASGVLGVACDIYGMNHDWAVARAGRTAP